jgi:beta-aspartyl-peptidase (threonine type)
MERSSCVLLDGWAADEFARNAGLAMVENNYFTTGRRVKALQGLKARNKAGTIEAASEAERHGTVGAVALDRAGNLAAATSTGGFNNKPRGRVGDSSIPGAGTYARNGVVAVSGTGQGEVFIRRVAAYDLCARMMYAKEDLTTAANTLVFDSLASHGRGAGLVAIDASGTIVAPFNTIGMFRGWVTTAGEITVATHKEEVRLGRLS